MAVPKLIYSQLRRSRTLSGFPSLSPGRVSRLLPCGDAGRYSTPSQPPIPPYRPPRAFPAPNSHSVCRHLHHRNFSTRPDESSQFTDDHITASTLEHVLANFGLDDAKGEESILPVRALISLLDGYHDVTGLPWWIVIASATLVMRLALFPLLVLQLKKLKAIYEFFPKLPPPIPPPLSGRSYVDQISLFRRERKAAGCPSYLWFLASISVQIPCFLLAVTSIRRMSLDHHPGFECGGALWFQNLTEFPHGPLGSIFPILISGLHFLNVQLAFENSSVQKMSGPLGLLAKYYKHYLDFLVLPLLYIGYCIPQHFILRSPKARARLGLPEKESPAAAANVKDPDYIRALAVLGQTLLQKGEYAEAAQYLERVISKILANGVPTEGEELDIFILTSQWAGISYIEQGKHAEGLVQLERVAKLKEPAEPKSKVHYFDGLIILASALYDRGSKAEAVAYARLAAAYNPAKYNKFLEMYENGEDSFVVDLVSSRRRDY